MPIEELKKLWKEFSEIPVDNNDNIERDFRDFPAGTNRFEIWRWFDDMCPNGVVKDLYGTENKWIQRIRYRHGEDCVSI